MRRKLPCHLVRLVVVPRSVAPLLVGLLCVEGVSKPETLTFIRGLDTVHALIDYEKYPDAPPGQGKWEDRDYDSVFTLVSDKGFATKQIRYSHPFYVSINGRKGAAFDYIYYAGPPDYEGAEPS